MKVLEKWDEISTIVNARSTRERLFICCSIVLICYVLAFYVVQPKLEHTQTNVHNEIALIQTLIDNRNRSIEQSVNKHNAGTSLGTLKKIKDLNRQITQYSDKLRDISNSFVDSNEMIALIKPILSKNNLRLIILENMPPVAITSSKENISKIYKHGLYLETSGTYLNHILFLEKLKQLPWNIFWEELRLQAGKPGESIVKLSMYTLNYSPIWLEI